MNESSVSLLHTRTHAHTHTNTRMHTNSAVSCISSAYLSCTMFGEKPPGEPLSVLKYYLVLLGILIEVVSKLCVKLCACESCFVGQ